jgi:2-dehydro-3-deoxygluconokinase
MAAQALRVKPKDGCRWDLVSLGEVMLRLDPGEGRIATTRTFQAWEGGGEYNVARALSSCFRLDTAIVTALADNPVGRLVEDLMRQGGVNRSHVRWVPYDGVGREVRNGLNFVERGFGVRGAVGCSDRGHTAVSQLQPGQVDWETIFGREGARWFHTGGIFCALSDSTALVAKEAMAAARRHGTIVSYDLNYRESLWQAAGGKARAQAVNRELAPFVDVMLGGMGVLGFEAQGTGDRPPHLSDADVAAVRDSIARAAKAFPNLAVIATTLRNARSATLNDWGALCYTAGKFHRARTREGVEVLDRIGSGDAFAAGLIYGLLAGRDATYAVECGAAAGALAMTTPGDSLTATLAEVEKLMAGGGAGVSR